MGSFGLLDIQGGTVHMETMMMRTCCECGKPGGCPTCGLDSDRVRRFLEASRRSTDGAVCIDLATGDMSPARPRRRVPGFLQWARSQL